MAQSFGSIKIKSSIFIVIIGSTLCLFNSVSASEIDSEIASEIDSGALVVSSTESPVGVGSDSVNADPQSSAPDNSDADENDAENTNELNPGLESLPRFEFGLAAAVLQVPAYPASDVTNDRQFLVPWFVYRSDNVQVKDGGVELVAYESENLIVDLGVSGSLSSDTSETPLREGMPDLDFLLELGPRFNVPLGDTTNEDGVRTRLNWITSLRLAFSTDFGSIDYRGPVLNSSISYRKAGYYNDKLSFSASASTTFLGEELMEYFYSVDSEFATDSRPEFNASAGFLNVAASVGISYKPTADILTFIGLGVSSYNGSRNEDSPLFETETNTNIILALSWRLYKSKSVVSVRDD